MTYLSSINEGLKRAMADSERVLLIGEDLTDPYGGAFKATKGISTAFPHQVLTTPISESAIIGIATGLAIRGYLPVAEIMFGDFLALCADQLLNTATKFPLMYNEGVEVPLVVRTPMGGGRGYGPTHSQSIEKMFLGIPGLKVVSPSLFHDPGTMLYNHILKEKTPTLFVEFKQLYPEQLTEKNDDLVIKSFGDDLCPTIVSDNFENGNPDIIIWGYGSASLHLRKISIKFKQEEIKVRCIIMSHINETDFNSYSNYITACKKHIIIEEGTASFNWGSELASRLYESYTVFFDHPIKRLSSKKHVIPASKDKELDVLISQDLIEENIINFL